MIRTGFKNAFEGASGGLRALFTKPVRPAQSPLKNHSKTSAVGQASSPVAIISVSGEDARPTKKSRFETGANPARRAIRIGRAAALLAMLAICCAFALGCPKKEAPKTEATTKQSDGAVAEATTPSEPETTPADANNAAPGIHRLAVTLTGEIVFDEAVLKAVADHAAEEGGGYAYLFDKLTHFLRQTDLRAAPIRWAGPPDAELYDLAIALKKTGLDAVVDPSGSLTPAQLDQLTTSGMKVGAAGQDIRFEMNGVEIAILSANLAETAQEANLAAQSLADAVRKAKSGSDFVILSLQWNDTPDDSMLNGLLRPLADAGLDIFWGVESAGLAPAEWIASADGRRMLALQSLGALETGADAEVDGSKIDKTVRDAALVNVFLKKETAEDGQTQNEIARATARPFWIVHTENEDSGLSPRPVASRESADYLKQARKSGVFPKGSVEDLKTADLIKTLNESEKRVLRLFEALAVKE